MKDLKNLFEDEETARKFIQIMDEYTPNYIYQGEENARINRLKQAGIICKSAKEEFEDLTKIDKYLLHVTVEKGFIKDRLIDKITTLVHTEIDKLDEGLKDANCAIFKLKQSEASSKPISEVDDKKINKIITEINHKWANYKGDFHKYYVDGYYDAQQDCLKIIKNNIKDIDAISEEVKKAREKTDEYIKYNIIPIYDKERLQQLLEAEREAK